MKIQKTSKKRLILLLVYGTLIMLGSQTLMAQNNNLFSKANNNGGSRSNYITVTSPAGGEVWHRGESYNITWTTDLPTGTTFDIYSQRAGGYEEFIATEVSGHHYYWTIPGDYVTSDEYQIKVQEHGGDWIWDKSNNFTITTGYFLTVTSPNGGESWVNGSTHEITWNTDVPGDVRIKLYHNNSYYLFLAVVPASSGTYSWTPNYPDENYTIRVESISTNQDDYSDDFFEINNDFAVNLPNGGEEYNWSDNLIIKWNDTVAEDVKIELFKNGSFDQTIISSTPSNGNNGYFEWDIPDDIAGGSDYKVKITSLTTGSVYDFSDADFTINAKSITLTSPNGGENWSAGTTKEITWTYNFGQGNVKIELYKSGLLSSTITSQANHGSYSWLIPESQTAGNDYKVMLKSNDILSISDISDDTFTIKAITVTSPNGGENWAKGSSQTITWTGASKTNNVKIELYLNESFVSTIASSTPNDGSFVWVIGSGVASSNQYKIKITTLDGASQNDLSDNNFTISEQSYFVTVTSPNGGENWQVGSTHTITWTDNLPDDVKILLYKGLNVDHCIIASTPSDGSYSWTIPAGQTLGANYRVRISGNTNFVLDYSNSYFTISAAGPPEYDTVQGVTVANNQTECYNATNTILVAGSGTSVDINSGGEATFIAGQKILFKPGFSAHSGSYMHAYLTTTANYCSNPGPPATSPPPSGYTKESITTVSDLNGNLANNDQLVNVYPNPTSGSLNIDFNGKETSATIRVINFQGGIVIGTKINHQLTEKLDLRFLPKGMYVLVINTKDQQITKKIIKNY